MTGFTDAEGSFIAVIVENSKLKSGWEVRLVFSISVHKYDEALLYSIKEFFGVGRISEKHGKDSSQYVVKRILN